MRAESVAVGENFYTPRILYINVGVESLLGGARLHLSTTWVAVKELKLSYHDMGISELTGFPWI